MVFPPNYRKTALCYNASGDWECFFLTNATASGHHQLKNTICRPGRPKGAHMPNAAISEWMKEHRDEAVGFLQDIAEKHDWSDEDYLKMLRMEASKAEHKEHHGDC